MHRRQVCFGIWCARLPYIISDDVVVSYNISTQSNLGNLDIIRFKDLKVLNKISIFVEQKNLI